MGKVHVCHVPSKSLTRSLRIVDPEVWEGLQCMEDALWGMLIVSDGSVRQIVVENNIGKLLRGMYECSCSEFARIS